MLELSPVFGSCSFVGFPWIFAVPRSVCATDDANKTNCISILFRSFKYLTKAFKWQGLDSSDVSTGQEEQGIENKSQAQNI